MRKHSHQKALGPSAGMLAHFLCFISVRGLKYGPMAFFLLASHRIAITFLEIGYLYRRKLRSLNYG